MNYGSFTHGSTTHIFGSQLYLKLTSIILKPYKIISNDMSESATICVPKLIAFRFINLGPETYLLFLTFIAFLHDDLVFGLVQLLFISSTFMREYSCMVYIFL